MAIPSFFKQSKPRGFNYAPRHYDPVKEEREARNKAMEPVKEIESAGQKPYRRTITKGSMRDLYHHSRGRTQQQNSIRLIIIILILVLVTYLYLRF